MVFGLELHAAHHQSPESIVVSVVSACDYLMINEGSVRVLLESGLIFMVANENDSRIEASKQFSDDEIDDIFAKDIETGIVGQNADEFSLNGCICTQFLALRAATRESNLHLTYRNS